MDAAKLDVALAVAQDAARQAGALIARRFKEPRAQTTLKDKSVASIDLVTETDTECEGIIIKLLQAAYPDYELLGEESASEAGGYVLNDAPTWIIDPIDGTTNFVHRSPEVMVAIGLSVAKVPVLGVCFNPVNGDMFTAREGGGAFLNGERISVDGVPQQLNQAVIATNIGYGRDPKSVAHTTGTISNLLNANVRGLKMSGSAVHLGTNVACGRLSCYYECGPHPWDICATAVVVREAGGVAKDMTGGPLDLVSRKYIVASSDEIASRVIACVHEPYPM